MTEHEIPQVGQRAPVVWTPEDAANFLSSAIKEAQAPLTQSLARQGVPKSVFVLALLAILLVTGGAGAGVFFYLREERDQRHQAMVEKSRATAQTTEALYERLAAAESRAATAKAETMGLEAKLALADQFRAENERLSGIIAEQRKEIAGLNKRIEGQVQLVRAAQDKGEQTLRALAQVKNEQRLVMNQMEGLREERTALAKQLQATRALLEVLQRDATPAATPSTPVETAEEAVPTGEADEGEGAPRETGE